MTISPAAPALHHRRRLHARAAGAARARAALRGRGADPERGAGRARRRGHPSGAARPHQARVPRRAAHRRPPRRGVRRAGLDEDRVVPGGGAARPLHQRAVVAHARRLQRAGQRHAGADRPLPAPRPPWRAARRLRRHGGRRRLRPVAHPDHRAPHRQRLGDRRREVVRDLRRRGRRLHRDGQGARGRRGAAHAVPDRPRQRRHRDRGRPALHAHLSARAPGDPLHRAWGCPRTP